MSFSSLFVPPIASKLLSARRWLAWWVCLGVPIALGLHAWLPQLLSVNYPNGSVFEPLVLLLGAMIGLVLASLVRSVWNRRARQHPAGNLAEHLWPAARTYVLLLAILVTPIAFLYAIENWRGARAWAAVVADLQSKGERLDVASITPPEIPDDQNFASTPLFKLAFNQVLRAGSAPDDPGRYTMNTNHEAKAAWDRLRALVVPDPKTPTSNDHNQKLGRQANGRVDLAAYAASMQKSTNYHISLPSHSPSAALLAGFREYETDLAEIASAAGRPSAHFETHPEELFAALLPHLSSVKGLSQTFMIRSAAQIQERKNDEAFADLRTVFRLGETLRNEGYLISQLVRIAVYQNAFRALAEGQAERSWTEPQLLELQRLLETIEFRSGLLLSLRTERNVGILTIDACRLHPLLFQTIFHLIDRETGSPGAELLFALPPGIMPSGWYYQNMSEIAANFQDILGPLVQNPIARLPNHGEDLVNDLAKTGPYHFLAHLLRPALSRSLIKFDRTETLREMAIVVCALERFRLRHQNYPETLSTLAPEFLATLPLDFMDGQPLRYRHTDDGWFRLYSVGSNRIDDGGRLRASLDKTDEELDWLWPVPVEEGTPLF